jgi:hypothetical protein
MSYWITAFINAVLDVATATALAALTWVLDLLAATVFTSPDVTVLPQVRYVAGNAQLAANACMGLAVMAAGILAMTHGSVQDRYTVKDLLPRLVIGFVAANMATPIVSHVITAANAVTAALTASRFTSAGTFAQLRRIMVGAAVDPAMAIVFTATRLLALLMLVLLLVTWIGRIGVLLVVAGIAPVALACHALPQTDPVARIWWRALFGCLAVQVLQAVTLHLAVATLLVPEANLPALGLPHDPTGLLNLLIATFVLWLVVRIPRWVARTFAAGSGGRAAGVLGSVIRVVVVQQALRAIGLHGHHRRRPRTLAGSRPPARQVHQHGHLPTQSATTTALGGWAGRTGPQPGPQPATAAQRSARPAGPLMGPPAAIPARRPGRQVSWPASAARPSPTGWPDPGPPYPSPPGRSRGRRTGTGWPGSPASPAEWKTRSEPGGRNGR